MKRVIILLTVLCVAVLNAAGQTQVLTFQEAVKIAIKNSIVYNQQKNNLDLAQAQRVQSIAGMGPSISFNSQAVRIDGNSFNPNTGTVINGVRDNVTGSLNGNINLFSGFNRINQIKQYARALDAQSYYLSRTGQDVINTVAAQYLTVMLDVELLKIAKENFVALDKQLGQVKEQVTLGARSVVDQYNQDALTKAAELRMVQAEITLNNDKTLLTQTLLIDPFEVYDVEKPAWDLNALGYDTLSTESMVDMAKRYRGDYLRAVKLEESSKFAMQASKGTMMPTLYAFGTYGSAYNFQHNVPDSTTISTVTVVTDPTSASGYSLGAGPSTTIANPQKPRPFDEQFKTNNVYKQYGLQLQIPIFNGLQNRTAYKVSQTTYENNQLTRKNLEYQIKNDVLRSVRNFDGAKKAYTISIDQVKAADLAFQLETERYNLGVTNFVDYTNANRTLVQAQTDKAQNEYRLVFQRILIEYAVGTLKAEDLGN